MCSTLALAAALDATPAPAASQPAKAEKIAGGFLELQKSLEKSPGQIRAVLDALNALLDKDGDPTKKYEIFQSEMEDTQSMVSKANAAAEALRQLSVKISPTGGK